MRKLKLLLTYNLMENVEEGEAEDEFESLSEDTLDEFLGQESISEFFNSLDKNATLVLTDDKGNYLFKRPIRLFK